MRTLWFALLFMAGGLAHEIRNPVNCQCITARSGPGAEKKRART